jgi:LPXTG-motif cell wall-anchored protein
VFRNNPNFFILVFILPPDATFSSFEDAELGDAIYLDENSYCDSPGTVEQVGLGSGLSAYYDRTIFICNLSVSGDGTLPADDTIYPFQVNLVAGESLAAGSADVIALIEGNDVDTITLMKTMNQGDDPLSIGSNNVAYLNYDPTELTATVNRCSGQGETTTDGTGCFTITFNKLIYVPSFTTDDFDLGGVGNVSGFNQLDDFTWRVNVSGILPGQQLTLNLRLNEIQDYSAQQNETQVLGINTIRFEAAGSAAAGTLPATGNNTSTSVLAVAMILLGVGITFASRRKALV